MVFSRFEMGTIKKDSKKVSSQLLRNFKQDLRLERKEFSRIKDIDKGNRKHAENVKKGNDKVQELIKMLLKEPDEAEEEQEKTEVPLILQHKFLDVLLLVVDQLDTPSFLRLIRCSKRVHFLATIGFLKTAVKVHYDFVGSHEFHNYTSSLVYKGRVLGMDTILHIVEANYLNFEVEELGADCSEQIQEHLFKFLDFIGVHFIESANFGKETDLGSYCNGTSVDLRLFLKKYSVRKFRHPELLFKYLKSPFLFEVEDVHFSYIDGKLVTQSDVADFVRHSVASKMELLFPVPISSVSDAILSWLRGKRRIEKFYFEVKDYGVMDKVIQKIPTRDADVNFKDVSSADISALIFEFRPQGHMLLKGKKNSFALFRDYDAILKIYCSEKTDPIFTTIKNAN